MDPPEIEITSDVADAIFSHMEDARDIARARCLCKSLNEAGKYVKKVGYVYRASENEGQPMPKIWQGMVQDLRRKLFLVQLRIETDPKLQSKSVPAEEQALLLSNPCQLKKWVPSTGNTLQHLCIIDYGQRAIMKTSSILEILSRNCKRLKTIDLRNMSIHTKNCEQMPPLRSFSLDCVTINSDAFNDISDKMGFLQTLAMRGVSGIQTGCLSLPQLKVLWLELSTKAGGVKLDLPSLSKFQLKMPCPEKLCITAPALKSIAFNLEVPECSAIKFEGLSHLQELLNGESNFLSLSIICGGMLQNKLNFDIPCMSLGGDPNQLGVLNEVIWNYPRLSTMAGSVKLDLPSLTNFQLTHHTTEVCPDELCITAPALKLGES
ncbi:unnamed protein product [Sphagnum troendelagicum]|uniref:F-box domain-containing protein n=1 Tax=Sphagnum troendelagicum TaxID=128251 RepID=A0ABP0U3C0_9BRYO